MGDVSPANLMLLGSLAFVLVTLVLYVLSHQLHAAISRHDLIREARIQRQAYLRSVADRRRQANADYGEPADHDAFNVDVVDNPPSPAAASPAAAPPATAAEGPRLAA